MGNRIGKVGQEHGAHGQSVVAGHLLSFTVDRHEADAHPPTDILTDLCVEVAIKRLDTAAEGGAVMPRRKVLNYEVARRPDPTSIP